VLRFVVRRSIVALLLVLGLLTAMFFGVRLLPGDPIRHTLSEDSGADVEQQMRRQLQLDRPLVVQYGHWLRDLVLHADLGSSFAARRPVRDLLREALPNTLRLAALALVLRFGIGVAFGIVAAIRHGRSADRSLMVAALIVKSMPAFWIGVVLQLVFAYKLQWLPVDSMRGIDHASLSPLGRFADDLRHMLLPVLVLAVGGIASTARYMRASMIETLSQDFVRAARARGLRESHVVLRHALRHALVPVATLAGLSLPALVGGALVVETIFSWPGMGRLAMLAVATRDYPVILGTTALSAVLVVAGSLLADVANWCLDPRQRAS
jgi:peptide/nickel transport system permease protein